VVIVVLARYSVCAWRREIAKSALAANDGGDGRSAQIIGFRPVVNRSRLPLHYQPGAVPVE
jgi:hypothetical protein